MPCPHILKIREIYRNPTAYAPQSSNRGGATIYSGWPERGFTLKRGDGSDFDFLLTTFNLCKHAIRNQVNACNCEGENDIRWLRERINELESRVSSSESNSSTQLVLRRSMENSLSNTERSLTNVRTERDDLQVAKRDLESRNYDLQRERDNYQSLVRAGERELTTKNNQIAEKDRQITTYSTQLTTAQNQLTTTKSELTTERNQHKELIRQFTDLQININNKDNEINSLKEELKSSQNIDLRYKERKLDELVRNSGLDRARVLNLRDAYERLMRAREEYNRDNIVNANNEIETIKAEFFQTNVSVNDLHKIYKTCEKNAELKVKQEKLHEQQYQAHQEQATNH